MTASQFRHDRLWPVLTAMIALLAGALAVQVGLEDRESPAHVIAIEQAVELGRSGHDDADDVGDDGEAAVDDRTAPVDEVHARARTLAHRGDVLVAIPLFVQTTAAHPDDGRLVAELGYWQLAADDPAPRAPPWRGPGPCCPTTPWSRST